MAYDQRKALYARIERARGRPLIVYATGSRRGAPASMAGDAVLEIIDQIRALPAEAEAVDVMVVSQGGDALTAWRVISLLRERVKKIGILVPFEAFSAATLLALGGDEIVMHPMANLGPVDPQLTVTKQVPGQAPQVQRFGYEDVVAYLKFVREEGGLTDADVLQPEFDRLSSEVGSVALGSAKRAAALSMSMSKMLLEMHFASEDMPKAAQIAEQLNSNFFAHGHAVSRSDARRMGLAIVDPSPELEALMWDVWSDIEREMECRTGFDPLAIIAASPAAGPVLLAAPIQLTLPANLPPTVQQGIFNQIASQIMTVQVPPVDFAVFSALVESSRVASQHRSRGKILAQRLPDLQIQVSIVALHQGWSRVFSTTGSAS